MTLQSEKKYTRQILIADDVDATRFALKEIISEMGYKPILAENGIQALKIMEHDRPHLILLDVAMPEMGGYELCKIIKGNPQTRDIPIIFISAFDEPEDIAKGFALGGEDYITKPFIPEIVQARVGLHLKLYEAAQNLLEMNRQLHNSVSEQLKQMEHEKKKVLYALIRIARENACYDKVHMERLSYNCRLMAEAMQLSCRYEDVISDTYIDTIELAAPLCDLGNIAIPTDILRKEGVLTIEERAVIETHTEIGARILRDIGSSGDYNDFIQISIEIAHFHHENWDGSGYPMGKKGEEIPLSAQIVALIGAYCALTENRMYRKAFSREEAVEILKKEAGKKFNPEMFHILNKIYRQFS